MMTNVNMRRTSDIYTPIHNDAVAVGVDDDATATDIRKNHT